jgi:hypothetical protein
MTRMLKHLELRGSWKGLSSADIADLKTISARCGNPLGCRSKGTRSRKLVGRIDEALVKPGSFRPATCPSRP